MKKVVIYLNSEERIVVYKEGGCQFERNLGPGFGWILDNDCCRDWLAAIQETQATLTSVAENIKLCA